MSFSSGYSSSSNVDSAAGQPFDPTDYGPEPEAGPEVVPPALAPAPNTPPTRDAFAAKALREDRARMAAQD
jgi:hypothetical protein